MTKCDGDLRMNPKLNFLSLDLKTQVKKFSKKLEYLACNNERLYDVTCELENSAKIPGLQNHSQTHFRTKQSVSKKQINSDSKLFC